MVGKEKVLYQILTQVGFGLGTGGVAVVVAVRYRWGE